MDTSAQLSHRRNWFEPAAVSTRSSTADLANIKHMPDSSPDIDAYDTPRIVGVREGREIIGGNGDCFPLVRSGVSSVTGGIFESRNERGFGGGGVIGLGIWEDSCLL